MTFAQALAVFALAALVLVLSINAASDPDFHCQGLSDPGLAARMTPIERERCTELRARR